MTIPTRSELRAVLAAALAQQSNPNDPAAAIRAAVEVVLPKTQPPSDSDHATMQWSERMRRRDQLLALADAIQGNN